MVGQRDARPAGRRWSSPASTRASWPPSTGHPSTCSTRTTSVPGQGLSPPHSTGVRGPLRWRGRLLRRQGVPVHRGRAVGRRRGAVSRHVHGHASSPSRCVPGSRSERIGLHGNNKSRRRARACAGRRHRAHRGGLAGRDRPAGRRRRGPGRQGPGAAPGHRRRRGPHALVHRDRARGPEVRAVAHGRAGHRRRRRGARPSGARAAGPALPHRFPDLRRVRLRGRGTTRSRAARCRAGRARAGAAGARPRWRLRRRVHDAARPDAGERAGRWHGRHRRQGVRVAGGRGAPHLRGAGPGDRRPVDVHALRGRHGEGRRARRWRGASLRRRRRRHERQHPHGAVRRRLLVHAGVAVAPTPVPC